MMTVSALYHVTDQAFRKWSVCRPNPAKLYSSLQNPSIHQSKWPTNARTVLEKLQYFIPIGSGNLYLGLLKPGNNLSVRMVYEGQISFGKPDLSDTISIVDTFKQYFVYIEIFFALSYIKTNIKWTIMEMPVLISKLQNLYNRVPMYSTNDSIKIVRCACYW